MAWRRVHAEYKGQNITPYKHHTGVLSVPSGLAVAEGDTLTIDGILFEILSVTDPRNNGQENILQVKEVKDEQEARRVYDQDGGDGVQGESDLGHGDED